MHCCADKASAWLWKWSEAYHEQLCAAANLKSKDYACEKRWTGRPSTEINQRTTSTIWDYSLGFLLARWQESEYSELVVLKCVLFWWFFLHVFNWPLCCVAWQHESCSPSVFEALWPFSRWSSCPCFIHCGVAFFTVTVKWHGVNCENKKAWICKKYVLSSSFNPVEFCNPSWDDVLS